MTDAQVAELIKTALFKVAPDLEGEEIAPEKRFRDQFEVDSMDLLNFVIELHEATGVDIPERDYPKLETLAGCVAYLKAKGFGA
jgi:acyl carrier protein